MWQKRRLQDVIVQRALREESDMEGLKSVADYSNGRWMVGNNRVLPHYSLFVGRGRWDGGALGIRGEKHLGMRRSHVRERRMESRKDGWMKIPRATSAFTLLP